MPPIHELGPSGVFRPNLSALIVDDDEMQPSRLEQARELLHPR